MRVIYIARTIAFILSGKRGYHPYTIPICVDNSAAIMMNESENLSRKVRHVEARYWYGRVACQQGLVTFVKVIGKTQQPADIGTKNVPEVDARPHINMFEAPYYT